MAKKANKRDKSYTRVIVGCFMVFFIFVVGICVYKQSRELYNLKKEELAVSQQIEAEKNKKLQLENKQSYYESDEYIEKVAREQLGLVKSGELVFINNAD